MTRAVPRIGRLLDVVGVLLLVVGAALYARSWFGLRAMDRFERAPGDEMWAAVERANALARLGRVGFAVMAAGALVAVAAAIVARRVAARESAEPSDPPPSHEPREP
jgi:hypothetical protein